MAKAVRAIDSHGVHQANASIPEALRDKNSQSMPMNEGLTDFDEKITLKPPSHIGNFTSEEVSTAIRKFSTASGDRV